MFCHSICACSCVCDQLLFCILWFLYNAGIFLNRRNGALRLGKKSLAFGVSEHNLFFLSRMACADEQTYADSVLCVSVLLCSYLYYISWNFAFNFEWFFLHGFELVSVVDGVLWEYVFIWWRVVVVAAAIEEATYWSVTVWFFLNISHCARYIRSILVFENMVNSVQQWKWFWLLCD